MKIALKIDVDTYVGTRHGIPRLLDLLGSLGVRASFYAVLGPDNTGQAVRRIFRRKGFMGKMLRTSPWQIYGWRSLLYGTVLPAPLTGLAMPGVLRRIDEDGHELGLHAYDHVTWQDFVGSWSGDTVTHEFARAVQAFESCLGRKVLASAAPGWQVSPASLRVQDGLGLQYASDSRGTAPFFPVIEGWTGSTLQIPGTLPTVDEMLGADGVDAHNVVDRLEAMLSTDRINVFTAHAEIEGMFLAEAFEGFMRRLVSRGAEFVTLGEVAAQVRRGDLGAGRARLIQGTVPGRAGLLACQGEAIAA